jgi:hypothetical protein
MPAGFLQEQTTHTFGYAGINARGILPGVGFGGTLHLTPLAALDFTTGSSFSGGNFSLAAATLSVGVIIRN